MYFRENSLMRRVDLNEKAKDRVMGMVELRGIVNELIEYQLEDYPDEMIAQKQTELNDAYDAFAAKNGLINNRANGQAFADDSSYYLLCSLENVDEDGNLKSKADMFTKRTIKPERRVTSVDTPSEALAISILITSFLFDGMKKGPDRFRSSPTDTRTLKITYHSSGTAL